MFRFEDLLDRHVALAREPVPGGRDLLALQSFHDVLLDLPYTMPSLPTVRMFANAAWVASWNSHRGLVELAQVAEVQAKPELRSVTLETDTGYMITLPGTSALTVSNASDRLALRLVDAGSIELQGHYVPQLNAPISDQDQRVIQVVEVPRRTAHGQSIQQGTGNQWGIRLNSRFGYACGKLLADKLSSRVSEPDSILSSSRDFRSWVESHMELIEADSPASFPSWFGSLLDRQLDLSSHQNSKQASTRWHHEREAFAALAEFYATIQPSVAIGVRLPRFTLVAGRGFRIGLLAALLDTVYYDRFVAGSSAAPLRLEIQIQTDSMTLARELQWLASSLGIGASIHPSFRAGGIVSMRAADFARSGVLEAMKNDWALSRLVRLGLTDAIDEERQPSLDRIPVTANLAKWLASRLTGHGLSRHEQQDLEALRRGEITRVSALRLIEAIGEQSVGGYHQDFDQLTSWAKTPGLRWHQIVAVHPSMFNAAVPTIVAKGVDNFIDPQGFVLPAVMVP